MSIRIKGVTISPTETTVGQPVVVSVLCEEITWENLTNDFTSWGEVRRSFTTWEKVKDYIYSIPNPEADSDCVYTSDGLALFDVDAVQVSVIGGGTLDYDGNTVNSFIKEVLYG